MSAATGQWTAGQLARFVSGDPEYSTTFKLLIVIGESRVPGKVRVCVWSASSKCWSNPRAVDVTRLEPMPAWPKPDTSGRRRRAIIEATAHVGKHGNQVVYTSGATAVQYVRSK